MQLFVMKSNLPYNSTVEKIMSFQSGKKVLKTTNIIFISQVQGELGQKI
jgi:hypothetical protein